MITVVILAKNEADNLTTVLPTLNWADEIVVIDDQSTDQSVAVCARYNARCVVRPLNGDFAGQRNFALSQVKQGWVLFLDADERPSQVLVDRIQGIAKSNENVGYQIRRVDYFLGKKLRFGETKNIWLTRLAQTGSGVWVGKVHETWEVGPVKRIEGELLHDSHHSVKQLFAVIPLYAKLRSRELFEQKQYWSLWEQFTYPLLKFLYTYIVQLGFLDGWRGLVMSIAMAWHSWLVRWYLWEASWKKHSSLMILLRYLVIAPILLLPWGQFTRGTVVGISVYGFELFMLLSVVIGLLEWRRNRPIQWPSWMHILIILTVSWFVSLSASIIGGFPAVGGLYWLRWCLYMGYGLVMWGLIDRHGDFSVSGLVRFVGYGLLFSGLFQYVFFPDMRWLSLLGWDDHYYRMIGSLFDPNFFGLMAVLGAWWVLFKTSGWERRIMFVAFIVALMATFSRTSMVTGAVLALGYGLRSKQMRMVMIMAILAVGIFITLPKPGGEGVNLRRSFSVTSRFESWGKGWELFKTHPVLGIGFNQYPTYLQRTGTYGVPFHPSAPDNSWIFVLATTGLVGFIPFVMLLYRWWMSEADIYSRGALAAIMIHSLMNNSFFYPWVMLWWWLVILENRQEKLRLS